MQSLTTLFVAAAIISNLHSFRENPLAYQQDLYSKINQNISNLIYLEEIPPENENSDQIATELGVQRVLGEEDNKLEEEIEDEPTPTSIPVSPTVSPTIVPSPTEVVQPMPTEILNPTPTWSPDNYDVVGAIISAAQEFGVELSLMNNIATCESGFNPYRKNPNYDYAGLYQFGPDTWISTRNRMGVDPDLSLRYSAKESARTAAFKIKHDGAGAWSGCL